LDVEDAEAALAAAVVDIRVLRCGHPTS
jgi:hypothetical protein